MTAAEVSRVPCGAILEHEMTERTTQAIRVSEMMVCCAGHSEEPTK